MESSRGVMVLALLTKWRNSRAVIRISLRPTIVADDCFVVEFTGVLADALETADLTPYEFAVGVGNELVPPIFIDLRGAVIDPDGVAADFFSVRLRDDSLCFVREVPTAAAIH